MVSGTCMSVLGRNKESNWVYIVTEDSKAGWVAASLLTISGDINRLSVRSTSNVLVSSAFHEGCANAEATNNDT